MKAETMKWLNIKLLICLFFTFLLTISVYSQDKKYYFEGEFSKKTWDKAMKIAQKIATVDCHSHDLFKPKNPVWPKQVTFSMLSENNVDCIVQNVPFIKLPDKIYYGQKVL